MVPRDVLRVRSQVGVGEARDRLGNQASDFMRRFDWEFALGVVQWVVLPLAAIFFSVMRIAGFDWAGVSLLVTLALVGFIWRIDLRRIERKSS